MAEHIELNKTKDNLGLECSRCGCKHFYVLYTRRARGGRLVRRRQCRHCGRRVTTFEQSIEQLD